MKLKFNLLLLSIILLLSLLALESYINQLKYNACDMTQINDLYKNVESELKNHSITEVEKRYNCSIILRKDTDYTNRLFSAIRNSDIVIDYLKGDLLLGKIIVPSNSNSFIKLKKNLSYAIGAAYFSIIIILLSTFVFIYQRILHPFGRLKDFARNVAAGELDIPLAMDKGNYFGAFTESFDMMREELKRAKQGEYEANISKKELVAELSHDIKTPVATIKALCELLEAKLRDEDTIKKLHTINQKADVIDKLISNMFHAALEELEVLKIEPREEYSTILMAMFEDLNHYGKIHLQNDIPGCLIYCDSLRLSQVIDNVINNSYKYADTDILVSFEEKHKTIEIEIRDYGEHTVPEDMPLVFEKFFRGSNASKKSGSGLGLYLAKQFMNGMDGDISCILEQGFVVKLSLKKV